MRNLIALLSLLLIHGTSGAQSLQSNPRKTIAVLNIDSKNLNLEPGQATKITQIELEKIGKYNVMDEYDIVELCSKNHVDLNLCKGKSCLAEAGRTLKTELVLTGSMERLNDKIIITYRLIDVNSSEAIKVFVKEFLNLPTELSAMANISLNEMSGLSFDNTINERLTKVNTYESATNNPGTERLKLEGPRMGLTAVTGQLGRRLMDKKDVGGYEALPFMTQFGYQFETQYLNEGNFQALFEFLPMVTGIDQGYFIPSLTIMNGFRNNKSGWEFAFGPTIGFVRKARGYYNNGKWTLETELDSTTDRTKIQFIETADSRGDVYLTTGFVFAVGKSFKSGRLNIPVNAYIIPGKDGCRVGMSVGFNGRSKRS